MLRKYWNKLDYTYQRVVVIFAAVFIFSLYIFSGSQGYSLRRPWEMLVAFILIVILPTISLGGVIIYLIEKSYPSRKTSINKYRSNEKRKETISKRLDRQFLPSILSAIDGYIFYQFVYPLSILLLRIFPQSSKILTFVASIKARDLVQPLIFKLSFQDHKRGYFFLVKDIQANTDHYTLTIRYYCSAKQAEKTLLKRFEKYDKYLAQQSHIIKENADLLYLRVPTDPLLHKRLMDGMKI